MGDGVSGISNEGMIISATLENCETVSRTSDKCTAKVIVISENETRRTITYRREVGSDDYLYISSSDKLQGNTAKRISFIGHAETLLTVLYNAFLREAAGSGKSSFTDPNITTVTTNKVIDFAVLSGTPLENYWKTEARVVLESVTDEISDDANSQQWFRNHLAINTLEIGKYLRPEISNNVLSKLSWVEFSAGFYPQFKKIFPTGSDKTLNKKIDHWHQNFALYLLTGEGLEGLQTELDEITKITGAESRKKLLSLIHQSKDHHLFTGQKADESLFSQKTANINAMRLLALRSKLGGNTEQLPPSFKPSAADGKSPAKKEDKKGGLGAGAIAGISIGAAAVVGAIAAGAIYAGNQGKGGEILKLPPHAKGTTGVGIGAIPKGVLITFSGQF